MRRLVGFLTLVLTLVLAPDALATTAFTVSAGAPAATGDAVSVTLSGHADFDGGVNTVYEPGATDCAADLGAEFDRPNAVGLDTISASAGDWAAQDGGSFAEIGRASCRERV